MNAESRLSTMNGTIVGYCRHVFHKLIKVIIFKAQILYYHTIQVDNWTTARAVHLNLTHNGRQKRVDCKNGINTCLGHGSLNSSHSTSARTVIAIIIIYVSLSKYTYTVHAAKTKLHCATITEKRNSKANTHLHLPQNKNSTINWNKINDALNSVKSTLVKQGHRRHQTPSPVLPLVSHSQHTPYCRRLSMDDCGIIHKTGST